jgi:hypothetical protein
VLDVAEQLRRYGEAVEIAAMRAEPPIVTVGHPRGRGPRLLAAVCVLLAFAAAVAFLALRSTERETPLITRPDDPESPAPPSTEEGSVPTAPGVVSGTAVWMLPTDQRGSLWVGACPGEALPPGCDGLLTSMIDPEGRYQLSLPADEPGSWSLAAYVIGDGGPVTGPARVVTPSQPTSEPYDLVVRARVLEVRVVGPDGEPFPLNADGGGPAGLMICPGAVPAGQDCPGQWTSSDHEGDGTIQIILDPGVRYGLGAFALNIGAPDPWISPTGDEFHFAENVEVLGADVLDGTTFVIRV